MTKYFTQIRMQNLRRLTLGEAGAKFAKAAHLGVCGLRHGVGAAGRLALEGKLCNVDKHGLRKQKTASAGRIMEINKKG